MLAMIPAIGVAICGFLLTVLKKAAQKFADLECDNCKKLIAYDDNVQIRIVNKTFDIKKEDRTIEKNNVPVESTIEVKGTELVTVEITCKCQECGTEKKFMHTFTTMRCNKGAVKIPYVQSEARLIQYESDVREAYENGLCEVHEIHPVKAEVSVGGKTASSVTTSNGVNITYKRPIESLVKGYFGNELN